MKGGVGAWFQRGGLTTTCWNFMVVHCGGTCYSWSRHLNTESIAKVLNLASGYSDQKAGKFLKWFLAP